MMKYFKTLVLFLSVAGGLMTYAAENMVTHCDITGIDKKAVVRTLYRAAKLPDGIDLVCERELTDECIEAELIKNNGSIRFLNGYTLLVNVSNNYFNPVSYNKYNGKNAAEDAINSLRESELFVPSNKLAGLPMRTNPDVAPYKCTWPKCGKTFVYPLNLKNHEMCHLLVRPYKCTQGCDKTYAHLKSLRDHNKKVHINQTTDTSTRRDERELFAYQTPLNLLMKNHTNESSYRTYTPSYNQTVAQSDAAAADATSSEPITATQQLGNAYVQGDAAVAHTHSVQIVERIKHSIVMRLISNSPRPEGLPTKKRTSDQITPDRAEDEAIAVLLLRKKFKLSD